MSDNEDIGMCRAFAVKDTGEEFDFDIPPTSGLEYLRRVQKEAKHCPAVVVAEIDASILQQNQTIDTRVQCTGLHPAPVGFAPTLQWQREQAANFSEVRQELVRYKARRKKEDRKKSKKLPYKENVEGWCKLCFGHVNAPRHAQLHKPAPASSDDGARNGITSPAAAATAAATDENLSSGGTPPLLSIVSQMDQSTVLKVLEYHINWFEATGFSREQGQWFYALMTCLEKPLVPEACSLLRDLARNCANLRATLERTDDLKLTPLNLLICLVARYFEQNDLADDG